MIISIYIEYMDNKNEIYSIALVMFIYIIKLYTLCSKKCVYIPEFILTNITKSIFIWYFPYLGGIRIC